MFKLTTLASENDWFTIINPVSGSYNKGRVRRLLDALQTAKLSAAHAVTQYPLHAAEIARDAIDRGFRKLVLVGGDGTYHEVVNSMVTFNVPASDVTLAMFPSGTGNDWVRTSGIPKSIEACVNLIEDEESMLQDIGRLTYFDEKGAKKEAHFLNVAGCGFDAFVESNYLRNNKSLGKLSYFSGLLRGLWNWENVHVKLTVDDYEFEGKAFSVILGIGKFFGGGMKVAPHAIIDDGLFDVTIIKDVPKTEVVRVLPQLYSGRFINHPLVECIQGKHIRIESNEPLFLQADGEFMGSAPFEFELLPLKLRVLSGLVNN